METLRIKFLMIRYDLKAIKFNLTKSLKKEAFLIKIKTKVRTMKLINKIKCRLFNHFYKCDLEEIGEMLNFINNK